MFIRSWKILMPSGLVTMLVSRRFQQKVLAFGGCCGKNGVHQLMKGSRGFTLLELLVAIAIIAILASLLLPALNRTRDRAKATACLTRLKQWGSAALLYTVDHREYLPPEGFPNPTEHHTNSGWYIQLPQELRLPRYHDMPWRTNATADPGASLWICPANARRSNGRNLFHYCLNGLIDGHGDDDQPVKLGALLQPAMLIYLFDSKNLPAVHSSTSNPASFVHTNLHNRGAQMVFLDGHAARFRNREYWDFQTGRSRTDNPELVWSP